MNVDDGIHLFAKGTSSEQWIVLHTLFLPRRSYNIVCTAIGFEHLKVSRSNLAISPVSSGSAYVNQLCYAQN